MYLHGLESKGSTKKDKILREYGELYSPACYYKSNLNTIYKSLLYEAAVFEPDIIIGSSMGGLIAYHLGNRLNKHLILFNPALYEQSIDIQYKFDASNSKNVIILQGDKDVVVDPKVTQKWLKDNHKGSYTIEKYSGGHRVPVNVFKDAMKKFMISERYVYKYSDLLLEKATSKAQQRAAGMAYSAKKGDMDPDELEGAAKEMYDGMSEEQLKKFAKTKHKNLPDKVNKK